MGIQGLLPLLKSIHKPTHLRNFSGQTLGVDAYGWLHRGVIACAVELAEGKPTRKYVDFALHRVRMLIHFGVKPYIVFDGDYLPSKGHTEKERAARRKESKRVGLELLRMGRHTQAQQEFQKAVDVTPAMARELIEELKRLDVPYVVAPYEADSQLAYLEKIGAVGGIISEDSDLLVFGVKCLLTKLDQYGECTMINRADFTACRDISLVGWTDREFRIMAMLSGCDYLPGLEKLGLKTAYRLVRKHKTVERVVRTLQFDGKTKVPAGYLDAFTQAEQTFMYQWVFCPEARCLLNLTTLPPGLDASDMPYIGKHVNAEQAAGVACGDLDPNTKRPILLPPRFHNRVHRTLITQTPNEKPGKPITEFFKKRVPLAELDPNSFTPSPSQQTLLETQRNTSWSASQIPLSQALGRVGQPSTAVPSSAPQASRRMVTNPLPVTRNVPPKRQRLCSDSAIAAAMNGSIDMESATSRFFAKEGSQQSPSLRKRSDRDKHEEFELWSDDSVAEAVAAATAIPELTQKSTISTARKRKKLEVFADSSAAEGDVSVSDESTFISTTDESQETTGIETPDTSFEAESPPKQHISFSSDIRRNFAALRYDATPASRTPPSRTSYVPQSGIMQRKGIRHHERVAQDGASEPPLNVEEHIAVPSSSPIAAENSNASDVAVGAEDVIDDDEFLAMERRPISPTSKATFQGSEDLIVPESPELLENSGPAAATTRLSLGRFTFSG